MFFDETGGGTPTGYNILKGKSYKDSCNNGSLRSKERNEKNPSNYIKASSHSNITVLCLAFARRIIRANCFL